MAYTTIDDPSAHFQTKKYTGNATDDTAYTNDGNSDLQPDLIWAKNTDQAVDHVWFDSTRGVTKNIRSNTTAVESTNSNYLKSFNSDGFTMGTSNRVNGNTDIMVAWQWKANGGTTSSNSSGDITSTVQANTTAGFSIVTYTGNGTDGASIGHGLSGAWDVIIVKNRGQTDYWTVDRDPTSANNKALLLHDPSQEAGHGTIHFQGSSGLFTAHSNGDLGMGNGNTETYVAYVFKQIQGYSKFGSYTGTGESDGPFIWTGFRPAWVMIKRTTGSDAWYIYDTARAETNGNEVDIAIEANVANVEFDTGGDLDFLSNGFKNRGSISVTNSNDQKYFYMAFAEHPFVSSEGVPCPAR
tara:strand:- start:15 stop:1076 length:1062 start_codon:yes stop_codon:yes gene_type:complete